MKLPGQKKRLTINKNFQVDVFVNAFMLSNASHAGSVAVIILYHD